MISRLIVRRIEGLHLVLKTYSSRDFKVRLPDDGRKNDEITILGRTGAVVEADIDIRHTAARILDVEGRLVDAKGN